MNPKEHRIYQHLSEPLTVMGLTLDELCLGLMGLGGCLLVESLSLKSILAGAGICGVYGVKKFKKLASGFSLGSFLHWHFGIMAKRSPSWPESWKRFWLS